MGKRYSDIHFGRATVRRHEDGGWILPGGQVTRERGYAIEVAQSLDLQIRAGEQRLALRPPPPPKPVVTRRRVSGPDACRHTVSA